MPVSRSVLLLTSFAALAAAGLAQEQQFAELGDFKLSSGEVIRDCRIGYRTVGKLNSDKSNVILFPTWALGTTEQLLSTIGAGKSLDLSKYYVVVVDALGNGVSSSPSNSRTQPRMRFPKFTIRDMAASQHAMLTQALKIRHLKAVMGISMGGMQTFQWMTTYPGFMDAAVPIVGSPRLAPYDLVHWQTQMDAITRDAEWKGGDYATPPPGIRAAEAEFGALLLSTPEYYNQHHTREQALEFLRGAPSSPMPDPNDKLRQVQAMMAIDVSKDYGGSMEKAAAAVKAKVLVVVGKTDHVVTPGPALEFARLLHAETLVLDDDCGHNAPGCEGKKVAAAVYRLLGE